MKFLALPYRRYIVFAQHAVFLWEVRTFVRHAERSWIFTAGSPDIIGQYKIGMKGSCWNLKTDFIINYKIAEKSIDVAYAKKCDENEWG